MSAGNGRLGIAGSAVVIGGLVAGCGGSSGSTIARPVGRDGATSTSASTTSVTSTVVSSTVGTTRVASTTVLAPNGTARAHAVVRVTGGVVEVEAADGELRVVRLEQTDGWTSTVDQTGPREMVVRFERNASSSAQVRFELTRTGILASTSESVTSG